MSLETGQQVQALKAHLALNVRNVEASIKFYRKMLGLEPSKVRTGYAKFDVQNPPLNLTLNERQFAERGALSHLGIQVASTADVLATREKWAAAGLFTRDEMQTDCCYATQDKTWVRDPDGNEWEVFVVLQDNLPEAANAEAAMCCAPAPLTGIQRASAPPTIEASWCCAPPDTQIDSGLSKPVNVCDVSTDKADESLVVRWC
ncbi:MAG: ArsI/CadI family heavy metal resistance metalloenzyme [Pyrinomonadaceae bacterium]